MKKVISFLSSMFFTGILIMFFAIAIAYATFIENDYGTITAKILIYNSLWFEILLVIISINLIGNIIVNKLVQRKKWPMFLFHIAFVVIIIGAGITRYFGFEGNMHIREGEASNTIVSTESFIKVKTSRGNNVIEKEKEVKFSINTANKFDEKIHLNGQNIRVQNLQYMPSTVETVLPDPMGEPIISMLALVEGNQRLDFNMKMGDVQVLNGISLGFGSLKNVDVSFIIIDGKAYFVASKSVSVSGLSKEEQELIPAGLNTEVNTQKVYTIGALTFAVKQYFTKGKKQLEYSNSQRGSSAPDALKTLVTVDDESKEFVVFGRKGQIGIPMSVNINNVNVEISYGSKRIELPFTIHLNDFQLERYPGSNSPSSFASDVVLKDGAMEKPFLIFMNNILKYKGYRFFQSSYDTDEQGTILSVNSDAPGTTITYIGYFLMALGMLFTLFNKKSRFKMLLKTSGKLREERKKLFAIFVVGCLFSFSAYAQNSSSAKMKNHIADFEQLVIQNRMGRIEPVSTLASQVLRKVAKKTSWENLSSSEVFLDMHANPEKWKNIPIIKVSNPELRNQLGVRSGKHVSFNQLVLPREKGGYILSTRVSQAYEKNATDRNKLDKEIIYVDERTNILMNVFTGSFLAVFPIQNDKNNKWVSISESQLLGTDASIWANQTLSSYLESVRKKDWASANQLLHNIISNQKINGSGVIPSAAKIKMEVVYNNINIFGKLSKIFMFSGLILLFIQLSSVFRPNIKLGRIKQFAFIFILILFIVETAGLGIRWYISGHAPWSNGYESMIFISWATCLGGLLFAQRSEITLSLTTVLAGLTLMVAGMSWMSPEITNLVPVLKSYWLIVHVAIITASYGFLGISALLGFLNLVLMTTINKKNHLRINFTILELVNIIQIAMIIGLLMLTIGSFLGGVWANESWGRYWGWDPKETWALVTILVYTFIGHMHKIPGFKGNFAISVGALVGISSVLMTYFGVNYYLSGLHSYGQGDPPPIPSGVYIAIAIIFVVIISAFVSEKLNKAKVLSSKS